MGLAGSPGDRSGQVVVVTGASSGIGRKSAERLGRAGYTVFAGVRSTSDGEDLAKNMPGKVLPVYLDVKDRNSLDAVAASVEQHLESSSTAAGGWRLALVNNAGETFTGPLEFIPEQDVRDQLEINLIGPLAVTQSLLSSMRRFGGRIVFVGSMFGRFSAPFIGPYCASKSALAGLSESLAMELRPWSIPVSLVEPGVTRTPIWSKYKTYSDSLLDRLPAKAKELYEGYLRAAQHAAMTGAEKGMSPDRVAREVQRAISSARPRLRYPVGSDTRAGIFGSAILPRQLFHGLTLKRMGLHHCKASSQNRRKFF